MKRILNKYSYYITLFIFYFMIALINQYFVQQGSLRDYLNVVMLFFNLFWVITFIIIRFFLPNKIGKYLTLIFQIILLILTIVNYFFINYFNSVFSWQDLILSGDGFEFISSIFPLINIKVILIFIALIALIILTTIFSPKEKMPLKKTPKVIIVIIYIIFLIGYIILVINYSNTDETVINTAESSNTYNNNQYFYSEWVNSKLSLKASGIYEYFIRDLYLLLFSQENKIEARQYIEEHISKYEYTPPIDNEFYGIFEGKNLILVMMESADDWQINEYSAPTITMMKEQGIDFTNHHSISYVTGKTAQSEFIANTGIYPVFNSLSPHYAYVDNNYKYSLANLFKNKGYTVNAFHRTYGHIYNRENMMLSLGYEHYYNVGSLGLEEEEIDMDSYFAIKGYDLFTQQTPFMDFYITYSNHLAYSIDKRECYTHIDYIKEQFPDEENETILCGYAQIYETDLFFKELLERLDADGILEDTVIIAFSDHPNNQYLSEEENEKNNYTEMFIYNPTLEHLEINKLTSTINILPMINNLFKLESTYFMASYDPLSSEESYLIYDDYTYFNGNEYLSLTNSYYEKIEMSKNILISDYYNN